MGPGQDRTHDPLICSQMGPDYEHNNENLTLCVSFPNLIFVLYIICGALK